MKRAWVAMALAAAVMMAAVAAEAGGNPQDRGAAGLPSDPQLVKGRIAYVEGLGGYIIQGADPVGETMMIANQNPAVLQPLVKSARVVSIKGRYTVSADIFQIESIDGKPYRGAAKAP